jgi:hypothetical protein
MKKCTSCNVEKQLDDFHICKKGKYGRKSKCKECIKEITKDFYQKNIEYYKNYRLFNSKEINERKKNWVKQNIDRVKQNQSRWKKSNKDKIHEWKSLNSEKLKEYNKNYTKERRNSDNLFKLSSNIRNRLRIYLKSKNLTRKNKTFEIVGLSPEKLQEYLEKKFIDGMSWDKLGVEIHIDHIIPLSSAENENEIYKLCHYTNLQPLWAKDNLSKNNKLI